MESVLHPIIPDQILSMVCVAVAVAVLEEDDEEDDEEGEDERKCFGRNS